jgi:hypothetical protein
MSSPESNETISFLDKPDKFDELTALLCRLSFESVLDEARLFNQLHETEEGVVKVSAEITDEQESAEAYEAGSCIRELLELNATQDDDYQRFGIKHATYIRRQDASYALYMLRGYQFIFSIGAKGEKGLLFNPDFSSTSVQLHQINSEAEGLTLLHNEGKPLEQDDHEKL